MTAKKNIETTDGITGHTHEDECAELDEVGIFNLTGFFDVLIKMDLAQMQRKEEGNENDR